MIVFDLDGCLIDSEQMIRRAYREAGAEPPADFLARGNHDWLGDAAVHARKDAAYLRLLAEEPVLRLPAWDVAVRLHREGRQVALLTGAPEGAPEVLRGRVTVWPFALALSALSGSAKMTWLASWGDGVYVDDQRYVTMPGRWRFVHYTGQDAGELYGQVTG